MDAPTFEHDECKKCRQSYNEEKENGGDVPGQVQKTVSCEKLAGL